MYLIKHIKAFQAIQRIVSRPIRGPDKDYPERLQALMWDPLELRRKHLSLPEMYEVIPGVDTVTLVTTDISIF